MFLSITDLEIREHVIKHEENTMNTTEYSPVIEVLPWIIGWVSFSLVTVSIDILEYQETYLVCFSMSL